MGNDDKKNENLNNKKSYERLNENNINSIDSNNNNIENNNNNNTENYSEIEIDINNNLNGANQNIYINNINNNNNNSSFNYIKSIFKPTPTKIIVNGEIIDQKSSDKERILNNNKNIGIKNDEFDIKFPEKPKHNDLLFSFLFFIQMVLFVVLATISIFKFPYKKEVFEYLEQGFLSIIIAIPLMLIFFLIWKRIYQIHPENMIKTSFFFLMVILLLCVALLIGNQFYCYAVFVILLIIYLVCFYVKCRDKIPFAAKVISTSLLVIEKYPSSIVVSFVSLLLTTIYWNLWLFTACYYINNSVNFFGYLKVLFLYFNLYWTYYVITYVCYSTISGLFAAWYFFSNENFSNMPPNPCLSSFSRAITTSFGSIAFGSLIVCIVSFINLIIRSISRVPPFSYVLNLISAGLCCFNRVLFTFNIYSFSMVAIYGESYCISCKKTYNLMINDTGRLTIAHNFMYITTLAISLSMCFIIAFIVIMIMSAININEEWFHIQMTMFLLILWKPFDIIFSGVITIVMCLISEPRVLENNKPNLYYDLNKVNLIN